MARPPLPVPAVALAAWTLFVWATRIRNVLGDEDLGSGDRLAGLGLSLSFVVLALAVVGGLGRRPRLLRRATVALAGWTVAVWPVRGVAIATGGHPTGFVVVHVALGVLSVALAWWAWRWLGRGAAAGARAPAPGSARPSSSR